LLKHEFNRAIGRVVPRGTESFSKHDAEKGFPRLRSFTKETAKKTAKIE
jgi:hypothetical protein